MLMLAAEPAPEKYIRAKFDPHSPRTLTAFHVRGPPSFIIAVVQQLAWLMATFRKPLDGQLSNSDIHIQHLGSAKVKMHALQLSPIEKERSSCWTPLFPNSVVARDFPVPPRKWGQGIQLSFQLMTHMAGTLFDVEYDNGIYLRGYSTLLFPTGSNDEAVQWHLVECDPENPWTSDGMMDRQEWHKIKDRKRLLGSITFLGIFKQATVHLGTAASRIGWPVDYSGAYDEESSRNFGLKTIQIGSAGTGHFWCSSWLRGDNVKWFVSFLPSRLVPDHAQNCLKRIYNSIRYRQNESKRVASFGS